MFLNSLSQKSLRKGEKIAKSVRKLQNNIYPELETKRNNNFCILSNSKKPSKTKNTKRGYITEPLRDACTKILKHIMN